MLLLNACERPFVEISTPSITVVEPDLSVVQTAGRVEIAVSAESFQPVQQVALNEVPMTFEPERGLWTQTFELARGINTLVFTATDVDDVAGIDTVYAIYLPFRFAQNGPRMLEARGGHTATLLQNGSLLVAGGARRADGPAQPDAFLLLPGSPVFEPLSDTLNAARTGHTATLLPDGRVLLLGGSRSETLRNVLDLVETVEIFDPATQQFEVVRFEGQPIRRAFHTAVLRNDGADVLIDLYGGQGDVRYTPEPFLGVRRDLRTFRFTGEALVAQNTQASAPFLEPLSGHTQSPLATDFYFVQGSFFDNTFAETVSFRIDYRSPPDLFITDAPALRTARTRHTAATIGNRLLMFSGGRQGHPTDVINHTEIYSLDTDLFFSFPEPEPSLRRFGHTATNLSAQRILLLGGFASDGNSIRFSEFFDAGLTD